MNVYLLIAEHFNVPGQVRKVFVELAAAEIEAAELVNIMLKDNGQAQNANASNWRGKLEKLQDEHGAQYCYIDIDEAELIGADLL